MDGTRPTENLKNLYAAERLLRGAGLSVAGASNGGNHLHPDRSESEDENSVPQRIARWRLPSGITNDMPTPRQKSLGTSSGVFALPIPRG
jgi:hypothetical protein